MIALWKYILKKAGGQNIVLDVRSPCEYKKGHFPSACSLPILNDEERRLVGICFKEKGPSDAVELGFRLVGRKIFSFIREAKKLALDKKAFLYCARGGKRSEIAAFILRQAGFKITRLTDGYKGFRRLSQNLFSSPLQFVVIAGLTGTGKTKTLHYLKNNGKAVLDFEALANHRGSAFGALGKQPSQEQFENMLALELLSLQDQKAIYVEDESRMIGRLAIPLSLFESMQKAPFILLEKERTKRLDTIIEEYGGLPKDFLLDGTSRLKKRLGGQRAAAILSLIENEKIRDAFSLLLDYYDKKYLSSLEKKVATCQRIPCI